MKVQNYIFYIKIYKQKTAYSKIFFLIVSVHIYLFYTNDISEINYKTNLLFEFVFLKLHISIIIYIFLFKEVKTYPRAPYDLENNNFSAPLMQRKFRAPCAN